MDKKVKTGISRRDFVRLASAAPAAAAPDAESELVALPMAFIMT